MTVGEGKSSGKQISLEWTLAAIELFDKSLPDSAHALEILILVALMEGATDKQVFSSLQSIVARAGNVRREQAFPEGFIDAMLVSSPTDQMKNIDTERYQRLVRDIVHYVESEPHDLSRLTRISKYAGVFAAKAGYASRYNPGIIGQLARSAGWTLSSVGLANTVFGRQLFASSAAEEPSPADTMG